MTQVAEISEIELGDPLEERRTRPVLVWALLGVFFLALQVCIYIAWFANGHAKSIGTGPDPVPSHVKVWTWILCITAIIGAIVAVVYVIRRSRREGKVCFDALVVIGSLAYFWQDPMANYFTPTFLYSAYVPNIGSWVNEIPGWVSPDALQPEPLLWILPTYFYLGIVWTLTGYGVMVKAKKRWPQLTLVGMFSIAAGVIMVQDIVFEAMFIHTGMYAWAGTIQGVTLNSGRYQFPLYESVGIGLWFAAFAACRYRHYNRDGSTFADQGIDRVKVTGRRREALRALSFIGFANVVFLGYNVIIAVPGIYTDSYPVKFPSYLLHETCGQGTQVRCPGEDVPIPRRHSEPVLPKPTDRN